MCLYSPLSEPLYWWGDDCIAMAGDYIQEFLNDKIIYAHNGGNFDFIYFLREGYIDNPMTVINRRILQAKIGNNFFRDSIGIIPFSLNTYQKTKINYSKFEATKREKYKKEIIDYCFDDCRYTFDLIETFIKLNGLKLTVGGASMANIKKFYNREFKTNKKYDDKIRHFYFGGRVQAIETGILQGNFKYYDVNSLYPYAMTKEHFCSDLFITKKDCKILNNGDVETEDKIYSDKIYLAHITVSKNKGALCKQNENFRLDFNLENTDFFTTSHEIKVALKYDLIKIEKVHKVYIALTSINFKDYILKLHANKQNEKNGNKAKYLMYKFLLNAGYGKFGQNANKFKDFKIVLPDDLEKIETLKNDAFKMSVIQDNFFIMQKDKPVNRFFDVGIASSITGYARSLMLEIINNSTRFIYCDTDSIICENYNKKIGKNIGDLEIEIDNINEVRIAGKKLYELVKNNEIVSHASKGFLYEIGDIKKLIDNGFIEKTDFAPKFKLGKETTFVKKKITFNK